MKVENSGSGVGEISVSANTYRTDGPWTVALPAGLTGTVNWNIEGSGNWYDFTVQAANFARRFAGRIETTQDGILVTPRWLLGPAG